jgi:hypothetical protein
VAKPGKHPFGICFIQWYIAWPGIVCTLCILVLVNVGLEFKKLLQIKFLTRCVKITNPPSGPYVKRSSAPQSCSSYKGSTPGVCAVSQFVQVTAWAYKDEVIPWRLSGYIQLLNTKFMFNWHILGFHYYNCMISIGRLCHVMWERKWHDLLPGDR